MIWVYPIVGNHRKPPYSTMFSPRLGQAAVDPVATFKSWVRLRILNPPTHVTLHEKNYWINAHGCIYMCIYKYTLCNVRVCIQKYGICIRWVYKYNAHPNQFPLIQPGDGNCPMYKWITYWTCWLFNWYCEWKKSCSTLDGCYRQWNKPPINWWRIYSIHCMLDIVGLSWDDPMKGSADQLIHPQKYIKWPADGWPRASRAIRPRSIQTNI